MALGAIQFVALSELCLPERFDAFHGGSAGAVFDLADLEGEFAFEAIWVEEAFAAGDGADDVGAGNLQVFLAVDEAEHFLSGAVREEVLPRLITALEEMEAAQHRDVLAVLFEAVGDVSA